jgi:hypothetical protein
MSMANKLDRWRRDHVGFIETVLHDPETGKPYKLLDAELQFLDHAFRTGADGRLLYPEQVFAAPKKSGKTGPRQTGRQTTTPLSAYEGPRSRARNRFMAIGVQMMPGLTSSASGVVMDGRYISADEQRPDRPPVPDDLSLVWDAGKGWHRPWIDPNSR